MDEDRRKRERSRSRESRKGSRSGRNGLQQFFTRPDFIAESIEQAVEIIGAKNIKVYWDPSAGTGYAGVVVRDYVPSQIRSLHVEARGIQPRLDGDRQANE